MHLMKVFFVDVVMVSNIVHIRIHLGSGHVNELRLLYKRDSVLRMHSAMFTN